MTIYQDSDQSTHDAAPVEAYKFIGSFTTYRYTSNPTAITVNSEVYEPLTGLTRKSAKAGTQAESKLDLTVEMPFETDIVQDYAFDQSPPRLTLELRRVHRADDFGTDFVLFWKGRVTSFTVQKRMASLRIPSLFATAMEGDVPNAFYQGPCNHVLFDARCKVVRSSHNTVTDVVTVGTTSIEVLADGFADGLLAGGEMLNQGTSEKRLILDNQADLITIAYPFVGLEIGDSVELTRGCNHLFDDGVNTRDCKSFTNQPNFGGFPFIPGDNPFIGTIK